MNSTLKLTPLLAISLLLCVVTSSFATAADDWQCTAPPTDTCFKAHGRLSSQNGTAFTIWLIGTKRIVAVQNTEMPSFVLKYLDITSSDYSYIYGDFEICGLEKDRPGQMRATCVKNAEKLVVQNLKDPKPAFRLLSTWSGNGRAK